MQLVASHPHSNPAPAFPVELFALASALVAALYVATRARPLVDAFFAAMNADVLFTVYGIAH